VGHQDKESIELLNQKKEDEGKEVIRYWIKDGTILERCYDKKVRHPHTTHTDLPSLVLSCLSASGRGSA
jgi:hypothetical protein